MKWYIIIEQNNDLQKRKYSLLLLLLLFKLTVVVVARLISWLCYLDILSNVLYICVFTGVCVEEFHQCSNHYRSDKYACQWEYCGCITAWTWTSAFNSEDICTYHLKHQCRRHVILNFLFFISWCLNLLTFRGNFWNMTSNVKKYKFIHAEK